MNACDPQADNLFGPQVVSCRDGLDFTLLFEQCVLSTVPSALISVAATGLICHLLGQDDKTIPVTNWSFRLAKQIPGLAFVATQVALVVLWSSPANHPTRFSIPSAALSLSAGLLLSVLSFFEHSRSVRPSNLLNLYLAFSILLDVAQCRTLWLRDGNVSVAAVFTVGVVLKLAFLGVEMIEKRSILKAPYSLYPPEAIAGLLNRSVFWWINSLLISGSSSTLRLDDLFVLDSKLRSENIQPGFQHQWESKSKGKPSPNILLLASLRYFWQKITIIVLFRLALIGFKFSQPLLVNRAVRLLQEPESLEKTNTGRALIGATSLIYIGIALTTGAFRHNIYRLITMVRSAIVGVVYRTTLGIDADAANDSAALTLMSTDVENIASGFEVFDSLWADPIEIVIAVYLLYNEIGLAFIAPIVTSLVFVLVPIALGQVSASAQKEWLDAIEGRVAAIASILSNMKGVKMMGLSDLAFDRLQLLRVAELRVAGKFRKMLALSIVIGSMSHVAIPVIALIAHVIIIRAQGVMDLSAAKAFTTLSLVSLLAYPIQNMAKAIPKLAAAAGCFQRIQKYITSTQDKAEDQPNDQLEPSTDSKAMPTTDIDCEKGIILCARNASFVTRSTKIPVLLNVNLSIVKGTWTIVTGPVGCGKSLLLLALLDELHLAKGSIHRHGLLDSGIGYCAQDPWLPNLTIRDVISSNNLGEIDEAWYEAVTEACGLRSDFEQLLKGDSTSVGSNGVSLSGGQKQRVSLARAVYSRKPLLILDDVLSGLDATTEEKLVLGVFGNNGLLRRNGTSVILATHSIRHVPRADHVIFMENGGKIVEQGPPAQCAHRLIDIANEDRAASKEAGEVTKNQVEPLQQTHQESDELQVNQADDQDMNRQVGDFRLYTYYFKSLGWLNTICMASSVMTFAVFQKFPTLWVQWWTEAEAKEPGKSTGMYAGIYGAFCGICLASFSICILMLFHYGIPRSSNGLHATLLKATMNAPYWFLVSTDIGDIVNRFSQDMSLVCMQLPAAFLDTLFNAGVCIVGAVLITMASKWALTVYPVLMVILYLLQRFYLRTSRQMRLLDLEAKAPMYSYVLETLRGIVTIKAFGWQSFAISQNAALLDGSQRPFYLMYSIQRWLNLVLDLLVAGLATLIMTLATHLEDSSAGALGVSLLNILTFSQDLTYLIRTWTDLETSLGAIARVRSFEAETPDERSSQQPLEPPSEWPSYGGIEFRSLSASYKAGGNRVLNDVSVKIPPGSKVGICGRTGSGKSTMLLTLLRLAEIEDGDILIDGVSITSCSRDTLRQRVITVPQDPLLLPGTIRFNADPLARQQDDDILSALDDLGLLDLVRSTPGGLDAPMDTLPLSRGQQQLFCLGRALLGGSRIVVLDEMSSSVDSVTEAKMMQLVHDKAMEKTVVAVAHHLQTLRHFDSILVLEKGYIVENGAPNDLLSRKGVFYELWNRQL
ncbi:unnamed protein product [Clonostachys solani]|uniref:Uncharacterized protein n=1 Tax=Clonostachys solani TaxID=160281 RepID=A0A9P0EK70_9HYPO|nr:unnamed protein product [Clonostachys solani]